MTDTVQHLIRYLAGVQWDLAAIGILWLAFLGVIGWGVAVKREGN